VVSRGRHQPSLPTLPHLSHLLCLDAHGPPGRPTVRAMTVVGDVFISPAAYDSADAPAAMTNTVLAFSSRGDNILKETDVCTPYLLLDGTCCLNSSVLRGILGYTLFYVYTAVLPCLLIMLRLVGRPWRALHTLPRTAPAACCAQRTPRFVPRLARRTGRWLANSVTLTHPCRLVWQANRPTGQHLTWTARWSHAW